MSVTLKTDLGDIKIELFCEQCPITCELIAWTTAEEPWMDAVCLTEWELLVGKKLALSVSQTSVATDDLFSNFLALCGSNYYNNCLFHRNIKGFMLQTGDPTGTGKGGSSIYGRKFEDEFRDSLKHNVRGVVSMANNGPDTNGSQFFFTYASQPHLDMKYTVFGKVIDGFDTLDEFEKLPVDDKSYRPVNDLRLQSITIHANPLAG